MAKMPATMPAAPPRTPTPLLAEEKALPPGARELTPEKAASPAPAPVQPGLTLTTATKFRCATRDGLSAVVEALGASRFRVQVAPLHRADAEQKPVEVDLSQHEESTATGPDGRQTSSVKQNGDGTPRPEPVVAFMLACGIRGSALPIGCTPLE